MRPRVILFAFLVTLAGLVPLFALLYASYRQSVAATRSSLLSLSRATARRSEYMLTVAARSLRTLARVNGDRTDPAAIQNMDEVVFSIPYIREVGVIQSGRLIANDRGRLLPPVLILQPDLRDPPPPGTIKVTRPIPTLRGGTSVTVELGLDERTYLNALIDPELFTEFHDFLDEHGEDSAVFLLHADGSPLASFGRMSVDDLPRVLASGVGEHAGRHLAIQEAEGFPVFAVVAASDGYMMKRWRVNAWAFGTLGVALSAAAGFFAARAAAGLIGPEQDLAEAIRAGQFEVHYQPIVDLADGSCIGAEALIRRRHPRLGLIAPGQFIPLAEQSGLIVPLTEWLVKRVAEESRAFLDQRPDFKLTLNVSARHVAAPCLSAAVARFGALASRVVVELTEHGLADEVAGAEALRDMRRVGVRVAVDDFGTGYSNLRRLARFPLDYLKIDKSFVDGLSGGEDTSGLVAVVIGIAKALALEVVAEGVEREDQAQWLREHGVRWAQGWLFARPMPWPAFADYARGTQG